MKAILCLALVAVAAVSVQGQECVPSVDFHYNPQPEQKTVVDLLRSLFELLNAEDLFNHIFNLIDAGNADMCELFLWGTGRPPSSDTRFLELLDRLLNNEDFLEIVADLAAEGADIDYVLGALDFLVNYDPSGCGGKNPFLSLPNLGAAFEGCYPSIEEVIAWVTANIGTADFQDLINRVSGQDNPTYRLLKTAVADPLVQEIIDEFEFQGYVRLEVILQLLSDALGLGWDFN